MIIGLALLYRWIHSDEYKGQPKLSLMFPIGLALEMLSESLFIIGYILPIFGVHIQWL